MSDNTSKVEGSYQYFMRPEPSNNLGPIKLKYDKIFGRKVKTRKLKIGMIRNASEENRREVLAFLEPYPHIRIPKAKPLQGWYKSLHEKKGVRARPCFTEALLTEPYGGFCPVGCVFCYINSGIRGYRGTGLVTVPMNYGEQVKQQLGKVMRGSAGYFTPFSDPFLPLENIYHNTQRAAEAFVEVGLPIFFLSRLNYPDWAIELLKQNRFSYAQKSINTSNEKDWKKLSPGSPPLEEHYEEIRRLRKNGIYVSIQVNPVVPGVVSTYDIQKLFRNLSRAGANHVIVKFAEAGYSWAGTMVERVKRRFGEEAGELFEFVFQENIGGQRGVTEEYRLDSHKLFRSLAHSYGMTYSVCYEYRYRRDSHNSILDKTGISIGREFTSSPQCHGQRVPVFTRQSAEEKFRTVRKCPNSGCLYCAEENGGKPKCGDDLAGQAKALRFSDLKKPIRK